jgi:hypothetical protein
MKTMLTLTILLISTICFAQSIKVQIQFTDTVEVFYQGDLVYATALDQNNRHIFNTYQYCIFQVICRDEVYQLEIQPDSDYNAMIHFVWYPQDHSIVPDQNIGYLQFRSRQSELRSRN